MQIWIIVIILLASLLAVHAVYLQRDYRSLGRHWLELEETLSARRNALQAMLTAIPELDEAISKDLHNLVQHSRETNPRRWRRRAALELRLSRQASHALSKSKVGDNDTATRLRRLDDAIQLALQLYQISAYRYNQRRNNFPGNLLAALSGLPIAPDFEIEAIKINAQETFG